MIDKLTSPNVIPAEFQRDGHQNVHTRGALRSVIGYLAITALVSICTLGLHFAARSTSAPGTLLYLYILIVPVAAIGWTVRHSLYAVALSLLMAEVWVMPPASQYHLDIEHGVRATIFLVVAITQSMVSSRLVETRRQLRSQYETEKRIAETFQKAMLPRLAEIPGYDLAFLYEPAMHVAEVGGDFLDVFYASEQTVALLLGDVTGHGLDAAVQTAEVRYLVRSAVLSGAGPEESLRGVNRAVCRDEQFPNFATVFLALLDLETHTLRYASAGHEPAILCRPGGDVVQLWTPGMPLGIFEDRFSTGEGSISIDPGTALVIYTDGITEARHGQELFGIGRIESAVRKLADRPSQVGARDLFNSALAFGGGPLRDDAAILWIRRPADTDSVTLCSPRNTDASTKLSTEFSLKPDGLTA